MRAKKMLIVLGPALLATLAVSPAQASPSTAVSSPAKAVAANAPQHAEKSLALDPYDRGYRDGYRQGMRDARRGDCRKRNFSHDHRNGMKNSRYWQGYRHGWKKGYFKICRF